MDDLPFKLPLILDGEITKNIFKAHPIPEGECPENWLCKHKNTLKKRIYQYIAAGSQAVVVPTYGANRYTLKKFGLSQLTEKLNCELVQTVKEVADNNALVCGGLGPLNIVYDKDSPVSFEEITDIYREQITVLKNSGVDFLIFLSMTSLCEMRAGMLAARESGLPAVVSVMCDDDGDTSLGTSFISSAFTMQALGAIAIGIDGFSFSDDIIDVFKKVSSYSKIPLLAIPNCDNCDDYKFEKYIKALIGSGVGVFGCGRGSFPSHISLISSITDNVQLPNIEKLDYRVTTNESEAYFLLDDENICLSQAIECGYDMADDLIDMEDESFNMLLVKVNSFDDAKWLSFNSYMARLPIAVWADNEEVLEYTLMLYNGIAAIYSDCDLSDEVLKRTAQKYGSIII